MTQEVTRFKRLGEYLRSRRDRLQPAAVGIKETGSQRRTPGLRREEVAVLAGLSSTYYTWLEQGREVTASREVMDSLSQALRLSEDERKHLFGLWNPGLPDTIASINERSPELNPQWRDIILQLSYPSFITNERSEVLAWNEKACEVLCDFGSQSALSLDTNQPVTYDINSMANLADHPGVHICIYTPVSV